MIRMNKKVIVIIILMIVVIGKGTASKYLNKESFTSEITSKITSETKNEATVEEKKDFSDYYIDRVTTFKNLPKQKGEIIFLGDSITDICEWNELFKNSLIKNRGISGDTTYGILNRLEDIVSSKPSKIFIMVGINDIGKGKSTEEIIKNYKSILNRIKKSSPSTDIYVESVLPINKDIFNTSTKEEEIIALNDSLKKLCASYNIKYIDLYSLFIAEGNKLNPKYTTGGIHINGTGYAIWREVIKDLI